MLDEQEATVLGLLVEQHRVIERQPLGHAVEPVEIEGQERETAANIEERVAGETDAKRCADAPRF